MEGLTFKSNVIRVCQKMKVSDRILGIMYVLGVCMRSDIRKKVDLKTQNPSLGINS